MKKFIIATLVLLPALASAEGLNNITTLIQSFGNLVGLALPIVVGLALLGFFWGLMKFIFASGDADKAKEGKGIMIWGVVAFFVMTSIWGLVRFVGDSLDIRDTNAPNVPTVPGLGR